MSNIEQCRAVNQLNPLAQLLLNLAIEKIKQQGINPLIVETYRTQERQNYLYAQGRTRALNKAKITWTLNSIHTLKNAVDLVPQRLIYQDKDEKMTAIWNGKDAETIKIIKIMESYGFEAGANWKTNVDSPHFQIAGVSSTAKEYSVKNNNYFITKMIQKALNKKINTKLTIDGSWGALTTKAINEFRKQNNWSKNGKMGVVALKKLLQ